MPAPLPLQRGPKVGPNTASGVRRAELRTLIASGRRPTTPGTRRDTPRSWHDRRGGSGSATSPPPSRARCVSTLMPGYTVPVSRDWEEALHSWAQRPSDHEDSKRDRTQTQIAAALNGAPELSAFEYDVYVKGSYANNTNVRLDFDVDIAVECRTFYVFTLTGEAAGSKRAAVEATFQAHTGPSITDFKTAVGTVLTKRFGRAAVTPGRIAYRIRSNQTTLPADVVPCIEYHRIYDIDARGVPQYYQGTEVFPSTGKPISNWPKQQLQRGTEKNNATGRRYKRMVRALKRLQTELVKEGLLAGELPSFLVECLVYNVPNEYFGHAKYTDDMRAVIAVIYQATDDNGHFEDWLEVNRMKYLFRHSQPWTSEQANRLSLAAWQYLGFD